MDTNQSIRVVFAGGGTGGHVIPLIAVVDELQKIAAEKNLGIEMYYFGSAGQYKENLQSRRIITLSIASAKLRRYSIFHSLFDIPNFFISIIQALWHMFWIMPDVVFSKGGPGAFPVVFASWVYRIPSLIHESDSAPGLTNILSSVFAYRIAVGFEGTLAAFRPEKTAWTGNPVRRELLQNIPDQATAKKSFGFNPEKPLILILGGSQGAQKINEFIIANIGHILQITQVLHQTGAQNFESINKISHAALQGMPPSIAGEHAYLPVPYFDENLKSALAAADLVVSRGGAGGITELSAYGKPSIIIPIHGSANDHQRLNAYELAKNGAASVIEENNLLPNIFLDELNRILRNEEIKKNMSGAAKAFFKPDAAEVLAKEVVALSQI